MQQWRRATTDERAEQILRSHIHMLHNRLGLSVGQEHNHYVVLAETLRATLEDDIPASVAIERAAAVAQ